MQPEHVVINIGEDTKVPEPPEGHKWSSVQHDNKVHINLLHIINQVTEPGIL